MPASRWRSGPRRRIPWIDWITRDRLVALTAIGTLAAGGALHLVDLPGAGDVVWAVGTGVALVPLTWSVLKALWRRDLGVDAIALVAMVGALALGEYLAGAVVAVMLAGGNALEASAGRRARRELASLVERAPRVGHRRRGDLVEEVPIDELAAGDVVVVRSGEVLPVDGIVVSGEAILDESALTGESLPVSVREGGAVRSGTTNAGEVFELRATRPASESAYAALVRLVRAAEADRAPFVRLADRYAAFFLPVTLAVAGVAWAASGDPIRALAVFVVATPCPLILAAPIALVAGISRAARAGIVVKGGGAIERLGEARTVLLDKTGTLTLGAPRIERVVQLDSLEPDEVLRLAASVEQLSAHGLGEALVHEAQRRGLRLDFPTAVDEGHGQGIAGSVDGRAVAVGSPDWLRSHGYERDLEQIANALDREAEAGRAQILVGIDGRLAGVVVMADHLRPDAAAAVAELRRAGVRHVALVTGDRQAVADEIGRLVGVDRVYAEQSPEDKLDVVRSIRAQPDLRPVVMVGDGINDAPALALADVGVAMGTAGATAASETADAVIVTDRIDRVAVGVSIGRRSLGIARQSVLVGIGLSLVAMAFAALGFIPPVGGALLQEGIDVAVILNALRALTD
jgi:heavy metal translocating P-type ATPase